ncbi:MAG: pyruvate:ferredoxin (flavodoxin) oxidoreductase [Firmicutes bacterium]|nr:pyruvate:ferredoxin (flavodoxin) oxidoreductase [Bacillota bacterium]
MARKVTMDGNQAAAYASYAFTEVASIYPITPSTPMAEQVEEWAAHGKTNLFGRPVKVVQMQSEAGAAATMRGALQAGVLATTYTASQGLLLMIPSLYKMAGELLPGVLHIAARAIATHALSIFGDHQDVMACRQTGVAMLASTNVQEVMDLACIAHLAAIKSRIPFLHFFDGFRTSHEYQKIEVLDYAELKNLLDFEALQAFRRRALNPEHPVVRGTTQNPDIYFQMRESANPFYEAVPGIVQNYMEQLYKICGRKYSLFEYYGAHDAQEVLVAMGSVCETIYETVDYLLAQGEKVGVVKVRLYRPFAEKEFLAAVPKSAKKIAVLDRTKEPGAPGEPLYLDVIKAFNHAGRKPLIVGGRYGLSSKDTRPSQIIAVYHNLKKAAPQERFTIGIEDDVTYLSLPETEIVDTTPTGTISCKFWGLGSDGTVGANKTAIEIIGDRTDLHVQAYFSYDSKKSGGTTVSHLRFGTKPIKSAYLVYEADYIACHNKAFVNQYDLLKGLKKGGTFVLNCPWNVQQLEEKLPAALRRSLAEKEANFYIIDAMAIADQVGLGNRINMIMQAVFFKLANVLDFEKAIQYLKEAIQEMYGKKGQEIVKMNHAAVDRALDALVKVDVPAAWKNAKDLPLPEKAEPDFIKNIQRPMARHEGDELPVSAFAGMEDGTFPLGTTAYEKRGIAPMLPQWQMEKCIQCGMCTFVCPHATIRGFLLTREDVEKAPAAFRTKKATGKGLEGLHYRVQIAPLDCTGCGNCADICPAEGKALIMQPAEAERQREAENWEYAMTITAKDDLVDPQTVKGSQFVRPLLEFNGACPGCGETPYIRLLTQLFGDRMLIANATGCSSIWGASAPSIAYTTTASGKGPAWINPLFEDAAEFGYGMLLGTKARREQLAVVMEEALTLPLPPAVKEAFAYWLQVKDDGNASKEAAKKVLSALESVDKEHKLIAEIIKRKDYLVKPSVWAIGGDGWAYDIGYGGLDHVLASGEDINIFVMDTELYSNTGGQSSKATPTASVAKLAAAGKETKKKDLGLMAMAYGHVYVAQIAMGANLGQTLKAMVEAEKYPGPSLIIAYAPCISHGIKTGMGTSIMEEKRAVEAGYWHLYRFNPALRKEGKNPFILDSKPPKTDFKEFLHGEIRYAQLQNVFPEKAAALYTLAAQHAQERFERYKLLSEQQIF